MNLFRPDHERYEGVRPINVYLLRILFLLVFLFVSYDSWRAILTHQGPWDHLRAAAICMFAAYALLSLIGVFHPLKMLPLVLFEVVFKILWLIVVAYPLWSAGKLKGSPAEGMTYVFLWVVLPIVATPWGYVLNRYILSRKTPMKALVAACLPLLILGAACHGKHETPSVSSPAPYAPLATFPPLGPAKAVDDGVVVHQVSLAHGQSAGHIWIYLPEKLPAAPMGCVFIAPAGVPPFVGNGFGRDLDRQQHPEHLPYVRAGFAVVAYDLDGELANPDDSTYEQVQAAATAFRDAEAGMVNARHAIDYVLKMVPAVDPKRLYSAGHSSAGRIALLLAENDPRIAACAAYAPVTDVERRANEIVPDATRYLQANMTGFREFLARSSPVRQIGRLTCPTFVFHSEEDERISIAESQAFVDALKKTNPRVTFVRGTRGGHFESMIEEGIPQGIRWLQQQAGKEARGTEGGNR